MRIENHIHIRHIIAQSFRDLERILWRRNNQQKPSLSHQTYYCPTLPFYSGRFSVFFWMKLGEMQTFFLLTFLKRSHDSSPVTGFFTNGDLLASLQQIGENSDTFGFVVIGEFVGDSSSQFPYFSELSETTNDGRMVHNILANILVVQLSSSSTATKSTWSSKFNGQPLPSSSAIFLSPDLNFLNYLSTWLLLIIPSPKSSLRSRNDCATFQLFSKW